MRKTNYLKSLLLAAALLVGGSSAWAQVSSWTASNTTYSSGQEIKGSTEGVIVMTLGNDDGWMYDTGRKAVVTRSQQSPTLTDGIPTAGGYVVITPVRTLNLSLTTYSSQNNCNLYMYEGTSKLKDFRQKAYNTNDFGCLEAGKTYYIYGGNFKNAGDGSNLEYVFYQKFTATTYESYTIHYVDKNGVTIKDDVVHSGLLFGTTVTATDEEMLDISFNDIEYTYDSGNEEITLGAGENEITLVYRSNTAEVNTLVEYGTTDVAWSETKLAEWTTGGSPTISDDGTYVTISGGNGSYSTSKAIAPTQGSILNLTAVWRGSSNTGRAFSAGNGSYIRLGNIVIAQNDQDKQHGYTLSGLDDMANVTTFTAGSYRTDIANCTWLKIEAKINTANNKLTTFTIKSEDESKTYAELSDVTLTNPDYTAVAFGYRKSGGVSTTNTEQLKYIKIVEVIPAVAKEDYTINYYEDDISNPVKTVSGSVGVGTVIEAESSITIDEQVYYLAEDAITSIEIKEGETNILNVHVRKPYTYTYTINAINGTDVLKEVAKGTFTEKTTATVYFPKAFVLDDVLYETAETNFVKTFTETGIVSVEYQVSQCDYIFDETELTLSNNKGNYAASIQKDYMSNGYGGRLYKSQTAYTPALAGGIYNIVINAATYTQTPTLTYGIRVNDENTVLGETDKWSNGSYAAQQTIENIEIPEGASFCFINTNSDYNSNVIIDYITLTKVTASVPVSAAGYATYCSPYALDFSNTGLTAYVASVENNAVSFTEVTQVPANEGVLLKGNAGNYDIPVIASAEAVQNVFKGVNEETQVEETGIFVLMNGTKGVGFYKTTKAFTIGAHTAYLPASVAAARFIGLDSTATGISDASRLMNNEKMKKEMYNLQGQRVAGAQPKKGLYVKEGRKVIIK